MDNISVIKVSIIVPVYNVEAYLDKCLTSLVSQTLKNIEIIIVNDGSTDMSQSIAMKFAKKYDNVFLHNKENGGLSDARNYGLPYCRGEYIGFIDSDDYVENDMYALLYEKALQNDADVVSCDYIMEYPDKRKAIKAPIDQNVSKRFIGMKAAAWNKIYKREWLKQTGVLFPKGLIYEDTAFFCELIPQIRNVGYVERELVHYVQRSNSIANTQGKKTAQIFEVFKVIFEYYKHQGWFDQYSAELEYVYARVLLGSSLIRINGITDKLLRKKLIKQTFEQLENIFPDWRKNTYIKKSNIIYRIYFATINYYNAETLIRLL